MDVQSILHPDFDPKEGRLDTWGIKKIIVYIPEDIDRERGRDRKKYIATMPFEENC